MSVERGGSESNYRRRHAIEKLRDVPSPTSVCSALLGGILGSGVGGVWGGIGGAILGGVAGQLLDRGKAAKLEEQKKDGGNKI